MFIEVDNPSLYKIHSFLTVKNTYKTKLNTNQVFEESFKRKIKYLIYVFKRKWDYSRR